MTLLESVKQSQRVTNSMVDDDYQEMIDACKNELVRIGLSENKVYIEEDTEIIQACKLYVHWLTDYEGKGAQWGQMYVNYTSALSMHVDYMESSDV